MLRRRKVIGKTKIHILGTTRGIIIRRVKERARGRVHSPVSRVCWVIAEFYRVRRPSQKFSNLKLADILVCRNRLISSGSWIFAYYEVRDREPVLILKGACGLSRQQQGRAHAGSLRRSRPCHDTKEWEKIKIHAMSSNTGHVQTRAEEPAGTRFLGPCIHCESAVFCGGALFRVQQN